MVGADRRPLRLSTIFCPRFGPTGFISSVNPSSWHPWPTLARSEPTRTASAGGQLRALNRLHAEALATLPLGVDAAPIDGPVWSVSGRGTAEALDRVAQIPATPFRLGLTRVL